MNLDIAIIKLMLERKNFNKYSIVYMISPEREIKKVLYAISKYYTQYSDHHYLSVDELQGFFFMNYPSERGNEHYENIFGQLRTLEVSDSLAADIVVQYLERDTAAHIVDELMPVLRGEGGGVLLGVQEKIAEFKERTVLVDSDESPFVEDGIGELMDLLDASGGIPWGLDVCDQMLRPLTGGTLGHLFARVESGKTTFISSTVANWVQHIGDDQSVLWVANEEAGRVIRARTYQSILNKSRDELAAMVQAGRREELDANYRLNGGSKLHIYYNTDATVSDIRAMIERLGNVRMMVIDIADHVAFKGDGDMNGAARLGKLYRSYRSMAAFYGMDILTVGQANRTAENRRDLHQDDMHNSATDKPGALDYAIGLGKIHDPAAASRRWLTFCKNKIGVTTCETNPVRIDTLRGRFYNA